MVNTNRMDDDTISAFIYTFSQENALKCPLYYYKTMRDPNSAKRPTKGSESSNSNFAVSDGSFFTQALGEGNEKFARII